MSGKLRLLIPVILLLVAGAAYFGWRQYLAPQADAPAVTSNAAPSDATARPSDQPGDFADPEAPTGAAEPAPVSALPDPASAAAAQAPQARGGRVPQSLNSLIADFKALHAACIERRGCTDAKWWDLTVRLYATNAPIHLQELYAAVSRSWRSHLDAGASADFDRELAIKLMNRARAWGY
jgi:hypothetical protein